MDLRPAAVVARFRGKAFRYVSVSGFGTVITQALIWLFHGRLGWGGAPTNVAAVCISSVPCYWLNRRWVWGKRDRNSLRREVVPFWAMALAGLVLSTIFAAIADAVWHSTLAVSGANIAGFGVLWVAKFLVLDTYLFGSERELEPV